MTRIRYDLIAKAIEFYETAGFTYIEAPWIVRREAVEATLPPGRSPFVTMDGTLVGSAEQAFIQLAIEGLPPGRYVAAGPCFRDDTPDRLHQRCFFKVELIDLGIDTFGASTPRSLAALALALFQSLPGGQPAEIVKTPIGLDIQLHDIELGSYGVRTHDRLKWVYGTGLAEPRFSLAATG